MVLIMVHSFQQHTNPLPKLQSILIYQLGIKVCKVLKMCYVSKAIPRALFI